MRLKNGIQQGEKTVCDQGNRSRKQSKLGITTFFISLVVAPYVDSYLTNYPIVRFPDVFHAMDGKESGRKRARNKQVRVHARLRGSA